VEKFNRDYDKYFSMQRREELYCVFWVLDRYEIKNVLEIGTNKGGTLFLFSELVGDDGFVVGIDEQNKMEWDWEKSKNTKMIFGDSGSAGILNAVRDLMGDRKIDLLHIDGNHTYNGAKKDYENFLGMVRDGGFIAFHDIVVPNGKHTEFGVDRLFCELKEEYESIEVRSSVQWRGSCGTGIIRKVPKTDNEVHINYRISFDSPPPIDNHDAFIKRHKGVKL